MLKRHLAACIAVTAMMAVPAFAQQPAAPSSTGQPTATMTKDQLGSDFWRASKLVGINIYGPNDEKVGDVSEVLLDRNGQAKAIVVGVGGFLGIGQKDVAIPFTEVQWMDQPIARTAAVQPAPGTQAPATTGTTTAPAPQTTGAVGTSPDTQAAQKRLYPDHGKISMTRDQLKNAPSFEFPR